MTALDKTLVGFACLFAFVALVFEPLGLHICGWDGLVACKDVSTVGWLWHLYASRFDPIFLNLPLWLKIMNSLDTLLFSWVYLSVALLLPSGRLDSSPTCRALVCAGAGALLYSTIVYFAYELIAERGRADLPMVTLINLPWTLWPVGVLFRLSAAPPTSKRRVA